MPTPSTTCRFCHKPGDIIRGAHPQCKVDYDNERAKQKRAAAKAGKPPNDTLPCVVCGVRKRSGTRNEKCLECSVKASNEYYRERQRRRRQEAAAIPRPVGHCACGCGCVVPAERKKYASAKCMKKVWQTSFSEKRSGRTPQPRAPKPRVAPRVVKPKPQPAEPVVIDMSKVKVTVIPPMFQTGLRNLFGED